MTVNHRYYNTPETIRRFQRTRRDALILGVCAGVADFFSLDRTVVRLVSLLLLWFFPLPTLMLYILLAFLAESR